MVRGGGLLSVGVSAAVGWKLAPTKWTAIPIIGPVSYTHLRAHETVLDLVCRLLLEKKTYQKNRPNHRKQ